MRAALLRFDRGSLLVFGDVRVPYSSWDGRVRAFRAPAMYYREILDYLRFSSLPFRDEVQQLLPCPVFGCCVELRDYQLDALYAWEEAGRRGVIVLPTGAGKTAIAAKAISIVNEPTLVVVPTLDLLEQWRWRLMEWLGVEVGAYGGGENTLKAVTVSTYDSAYLRAAELGNRFSLLVFDEVHHLPSEGYRQIAEMFTAPYRMGLTATYEREDMLHLDLPRLVGGVVYRLKPQDLAGRYLAEYEVQRVGLKLSEDERRVYEENFRVYRDYLRSRGLRLSSHLDFQKLVAMSVRDRGARRALLARNRALDVAFNSEAKLESLERILRENPDERILIFTQHNRLVHRISRRFLIPYITHRSSKEERREVLKGFREGRYRAIVTSKVLDEGVDVPEASIGVIVSGTGSSREFIQRLGRLLRKREGKRARLIELVSKATSEARVSWRRKRGLG